MDADNPSRSPELERTVDLYSQLIEKLEGVIVNKNEVTMILELVEKYYNARRIYVYGRSA